MPKNGGLHSIFISCVFLYRSNQSGYVCLVLIEKEPGLLAQGLKEGLVVALGGQDRIQRRAHQRFHFLLPRLVDGLIGCGIIYRGVYVIFFSEVLVDILPAEKTRHPLVDITSIQVYHHNKSLLLLLDLSLDLFPVDDDVGADSHSRKWNVPHGKVGRVDGGVRGTVAPLCVDGRHQDYVEDHSRNQANHPTEPEEPKWLIFCS